MSNKDWKPIESAISGRAVIREGRVVEADSPGIAAQAEE